jgi:tetratricopeptide (TPR) repeat protein
MVDSQSNLSATLTGDKRLVRLQAGTRTYSLSLERAFAAAHSLLKSREYEAAIRVLEAIARSGNNGARIDIMLACCKAGIKDYTSCNALLHRVFSGESQSTADQVQAAFVYDTLGMRNDAARELTVAVDERPDLPSLSLLLGDLMAALGKASKAALYWQLAMKRDEDSGLVANAAKEELKKLVETTPKNATKPHEQSAKTGSIW